MRTVRHAQMEIGEARIEDIEPDPKSRDNIPALLTGLQHLYRNEETREALSALPGGTCCPAGIGTTAVRAWVADSGDGGSRQGLSCGCTGR